MTDGTTILALPDFLAGLGLALLMLWFLATICVVGSVLLRGMSRKIAKAARP